MKFRNNVTYFALAILVLISPVSLADAPSVQTLVRTQTSWDGTPLPVYPEGQPEVTILRITIPPGARLPEHLHPVINAGVLLRGQLRVIAGDQTLDLQAGDAIVELVDKWHYGSNPGDTEAEIIVFYAGVEGRAVTVPRD